MTSAEIEDACPDGAWPPRDVDLSVAQPHRVPWLESPPGVIDIDRGRQLPVDDYVVDDAGTTMARAYHQPVKYPANPVLFPMTQEECGEPYPPCAVAKCGGVWYDGRDGRFKMWYMAGYVGYMAHAVSEDGIHWERPQLDVVPGTNLCLPRDHHPDSGSVVIDYESGDDRTRYKMLVREPNTSECRDRFPTETVVSRGCFPGRLLTSPDGVHWTEAGITGPMDDRSTMYYDAFRKRWVQSIRCYQSGPGRCRLFRESASFLESGRWAAGEPTPWCRADGLDAGGDICPELYNLDAVPYESLLLGFHQVFRGPPNGVCAEVGLPKLTELTVGYSRDGFHWYRPDRRSFVAARREPGSWEYGYVESSAGMLHVVGDELWIYYSAYGGDPTRITQRGLANGMYANGAVGLAKLRRDGFASMQARFPGAMMTTRPVRFSGSHLFINASTAGAPLRVEVLSGEGDAPIPGFAAGDCVPFTGNSTAAEVRWERKGLGELTERPVRFRFTFDRGDLYAFWVARDERGKSGGYLGAGGPGYSQPVDI